MIRRISGLCAWLLLAICLYFFENNTGTRIVLLLSLLLPLIPSVRASLLRRDSPEASETLQPVSRTLSVPGEELFGDVRTYQPGDPVNRIHWKLSAKRRELLSRQVSFDDQPACAPCDLPVPAPDRSAQRKRRAVRLLALLLPVSACLLFLRSIRVSAMALANSVFDLSEQSNAYLYEHFPVFPDTSLLPALLLLLLILGILLGILLLSGSRLLALGMAAVCVIFQVYFGLSLPAPLQVALFLLLVLWCLARPLEKRVLLHLTLCVLAVSLLVCLVFPGTDLSVETASEQVRDLLSRLTGAQTALLSETPAGETETRHLHGRTLTEGSQGAKTEREFQLVTLQEVQISQPPWTGLLRTVLLLLGVIAALVLPFLPFMLMEMRRRKALEAQKVFASENLREAVLAIFQNITGALQVLGMDGGNLPYRAWENQLAEKLTDGYARHFSECVPVFEQAAYSDHPLSENQRQQALDLLYETRQLLESRSDWQQKLRLRYGECLWVASPS